MHGDDDSPHFREAGPPGTQEGPEAGASGTLEAAENVVRRSYRELRAPAGTRPADFRSRLARINKARQASDLKAWTREKSLLLSSAEFDLRWHSQGGVAGQECDVYYDERVSCYIKRNHTVAYEDWIQFFASVRIHNDLFVDTPYTLLGFMEVKRNLCAILSQPAVRSTRGAERSAVENYMARFGFRHVGHDHYESMSLMIQDLHSENVLIGPNDGLYFIDTCIYVKEGKEFSLLDAQD